MSEAIDVTIAAPGGIDLAGHVRLADDAAGQALVFTGPFTGVKEQVVGHYAAALSDRGFVTLAFDHRNFGASTGEPRQHEDAAGKGLDLLAATSWLAAHDAVDPARIGCVGICLGGSYAVRHTAFDPRIGALGLVAGGYNDPVWFAEQFGDGGYRDTLAALADVAAAEQRTGEIAYVPAVDGEGGEAAMPGAEPFEYYGTARSAAPNWVNRMTRLSLREILTLDARSPAALTAGRPTLMIHGRRDDYCTPEGAELTFARLGEPKRLEWLDTSNHVDLYDNPVFVEPAIDLLASFFADQL